MTQVFFTKHGEGQYRSRLNPVEQVMVLDALTHASENPSLAKPVFTTGGGPVATTTGVVSGAPYVYELRKSQWRILFSKSGDNIFVLTIIKQGDDQQTALNEVLDSVVTEVSSASSKFVR